MDRKCPQCGEIRISTQNQYIDQPISGYDDIEEGDYVVLTVADGGIGLGMAAKAELEKSQQTA